MLIQKQAVENREIISDEPIKQDQNCTLKIASVIACTVIISFSICFMIYTKMKKNQKIECLPIPLPKISDKIYGMVALALLTVSAAIKIKFYKDKKPVVPLKAPNPSITPPITPKISPSSHQKLLDQNMPMMNQDDFETDPVTGALTPTIKIP
jgi:hypothetical protein